MRAGDVSPSFLPLDARLRYLFENLYIYTLDLKPSKRGLMQTIISIKRKVAHTISLECDFNSVVEIYQTYNKESNEAV